MNSRDMCMIEHIPELMAAGVSSLKIEGRMKSAYYAAVITNAYRHAVDEAAAGEPLSETWRREAFMVSHREYSTGFYFGDPGQYYGGTMYSALADVCAVVEDGGAEGGLSRLTQRNRIFPGDRLELLNASGPPQGFAAGRIYDAGGSELECAAHPMMEFFMELPAGAERLSILRKIRE